LTPELFRGEEERFGGAVESLTALQTRRRSTAL
jgi:hypothetical protein